MEMLGGIPKMSNQYCSIGQGVILEVNNDVTSQARDIADFLCGHLGVALLQTVKRHVHYVTSQGLLALRVVCSNRCIHGTMDIMRQSQREVGSANGSGQEDLARSRQFLGHLMETERLAENPCSAYRCDLSMVVAWNIITGSLTTAQADEFTTVLAELVEGGLQGDQFRSLFSAMRRFRHRCRERVS